MTGPTPGTVVVLRHPARTVRIAAELADAGLRTYAMPLTDVELPPDTAPVRAALADLGRGTHRWLVVTSGNTVQALGVLAASLGSPLADLVRGTGTRVAAVGPATARALADQGVPVHLVPEDDASSGGLLRQFPSGPGTLLLPQADLAPDDLRAGLTELGWSVRRVEAYRTVPHPAEPSRRLPGIEEPGTRPRLMSPQQFADLVRSGVRPAVVFTAPSAVAQFREMLVDVPPAFHPVSIGRTTSAALQQQGWGAGTTAPNPSPQGVARAVTAALTPRPADPAADDAPAGPSNGERP
ncbi:uroporphyrinogen-III synthase [Arthrobacter sp. RIT-PI-e]|uniref:uroporphyrinogen-III synthase n=1 Tax=Arthrobacter sp. RIT-PI-e TaxID=1681197 RepID=UPI000675D0A9|nr:uroporphyrinogen-III synthase [Arthrobacter sp. RIT-PI-e]